MESVRGIFPTLTDVQFALVIGTAAVATVCSLVHWILIEAAVRREQDGVPTAVKVGYWHYGMLRRSYYGRPGRVYPWIPITFAVSMAGYLATAVMLFKWG